MCVSRIQRLMTAFVLCIVLYFFYLSDLENAKQIALYLQVFVIFMLSLWAFTNFCPSIWLLKKIFPPCKWEE
jgi:lipopolysaccharide export LptBFGC system permease protein LptF